MEITGNEPTVHHGPRGPYSEPAPGCAWAVPDEPHPAIVDFTRHPDYLSAHNFTRPYLAEGHADPYPGALTSLPPPRS